MGTGNTSFGDWSDLAHHGPPSSSSVDSGKRSKLNFEGERHSSNVVAAFKLAVQANRDMKRGFFRLKRAIV